MLGDDESLKNYLPMNPEDILDKLSDGVILCKLL